MAHVVIIGNGVAGITAARHIRKRSDHRITVISSESEYFYSRTALMYVYMGHMTFQHTKPYEDSFWKKNRIDLLFDHAETVAPAEKIVLLKCGKSVAYDQLIIACGSRSIILDIPGTNLRGVQTLYSYQDLQRMETHTQGISHAVIVGGGLIGVEMAEMLSSRNVKVTMLIREQAFWSNVLPLQEARMIDKHLFSHGIDLRHEQQVKEIVPNGNGGARAVKTNSNEEIPTDFVCIAVGVHPNVKWLRHSHIDIKQGILVNEYLETNVPGIYAIGDCVERRYALAGRKSIEQVWYTARMMGECVAQTICGDKTPYQPGPWFNSAKFFDIEFQTYGNVGNTLAEGEDDFYWEHSSGTKAIHVVWEKHSGRFCGINSFGIRLRHERFDRWLREERSIQFVMQHLHEANFDPEFTDRHEADILHRFEHKQLIAR